MNHPTLLAFPKVINTTNSYFLVGCAHVSHPCSLLLASFGRVMPQCPCKPPPRRALHGEFAVPELLLGTKLHVARGLPGCGAVGLGNVSQLAIAGRAQEGYGFEW